MDHIEFDAKVEDTGVIRIPGEYVLELAKKAVHVTVRSEMPERETVRFMREHPIMAPGLKPLTREEIYERNR